MNIIGFCKALSYHLERHDNTNLKNVLLNNPDLFAKYKSMTSVQGNLYNHYEVAIRSGNIQGMCILLEEGFDLHRNNRYGYNPMESAVSTLDFNTVCLLKSLGCSYSCQCLHNFILTFGALKTCDSKTLEVLILACEPEEFLKAYGEFISGVYFDRDNCHQLLGIISSRLNVVLKDVVLTDMNQDFVLYLFMNDFVDTSSVLKECTRVMCFKDYPMVTDIFHLSKTIKLCIDTCHGYGSDVTGFTEAYDQYMSSNYRDPLVVLALMELKSYISYRHRLPFISSRVRRPSVRNEMTHFVCLSPEIFSRVMSYLV